MSVGRRREEGAPTWRRIRLTGNGDTWSATSGNQLSSPITSPTTYSLSCDSSALTGTVFILPIPGWREF
jgi:hypothetical protein